MKICSIAVEVSFVRNDFNRVPEGLGTGLVVGFFRLSIGSGKEIMQEGIFLFASLKSLQAWFRKTPIQIRFYGL